MIEKVPILSPMTRWIVSGLSVVTMAVVMLATGLGNDGVRKEQTSTPALTCAGRTDDPACDPYANLMFPGSTWRDLPPDETPYIEQMLAARQAIR